MRRHPEMQPGDLDQRITIQEHTRTSDGAGGGEYSWSDVGDVWAKVEPVRGQERVIADQERGTQTYRITGRNNGDFANIATGDRIIWGGLTLNVRTAPNGGRALYRLIEAEKGVET